MTNHCNLGVVQYNNKKIGYNLYLVAINLVLLLFISYGSQKLNIAHRIFVSTRITKTPKHYEPIV